MHLPQIQINSTSAKLGIQRNPTQIEMKQPKGDMSIRQPQADIRYENHEGTLQIDQTEAFADANLKHINRRIEEWAKRGQQHVLQTIAKIVKQGDQLMKIEKGGSMIPQIARANSEPEHKGFNIGFMPSSVSKVRINFEHGDLEIKIKQNTPKIETKMNEPIITVKPGDLQIYLKQKASMSFSVPGLNVNQVG